MKFFLKFEFIIGIDETFFSVNTFPNLCFDQTTDLEIQYYM